MFLFCSLMQGLAHAPGRPAAASCGAARHHCRYRAQAGAGRGAGAGGIRHGRLSAIAGRAGAGDLHRQEPPDRGRAGFCPGPGPAPSHRPARGGAASATGRRIRLCGPALCPRPGIFRLCFRPAHPGAARRHGRAALGRRGGGIVPGGGGGDRRDRRQCPTIRLHRQPAPEPAGQRRRLLAVPAARRPGPARQRRPSALASPAGAERPPPL